jgi:CheY-like chemotaxis protein
LVEAAGAPKMRLLVIEDEVKVARALADGLSREGYEVAVARTSEEGYYLLDSETFDLVKGSTFRVILPAANPRATPASDRAYAGDEGSGH